MPRLLPPFNHRERLALALYHGLLLRFLKSSLRTAYVQRYNPRGARVKKTWKQGREAGRQIQGEALLSWPQPQSLSPLSRLPDRPCGIAEPGSRPLGRRRGEFIFWLLLPPVSHRSRLALPGVNMPLCIWAASGPSRQPLGNPTPHGRAIQLSLEQWGDLCGSA